MNGLKTTRDHISELVRSTWAADPFEAIRIKAKGAIDKYRETFGEPAIPLNVDAVASMLGIRRSDDAPTHSSDAELVPTPDGRVAIRVNPDKPETRQRFSIGHEVSHTFFPNYQGKTWCRTDARYRRRDNPDDLLEMLCDVGSAELILPAPWFIADAAAVNTGAGLVELARRYGVSREAALRRFAETHANSVAAVFLSWKLKPTQERRIGRTDQHHLFGAPTEADRRRSRKLRLDYSIASSEFAQTGRYLPADKSVENEGPLYQAALTGAPCEGECLLDLGQARGRYRVLAAPVWTSDEDLGPDGENGVAAVIFPLEQNQTKRGGPRSDRPLFD